MKNKSLDFKLTNYHSHTWRCMHAERSEEDFIRKAIKCGFSTFGFADHTPWPYRSDFVASMRMRIDQLEDYIDTLRELRERYADKINIPIGLECEAFPEFFPWLRELKDSGKVDYLLLGNHYENTDEYHTDPYFGHICDPELVERYVDATVTGMRSGLFAYLCHPDLYLNDYPVFDDYAQSAAHRICEEAERLNMPLEYNLLGMRRNPGARRACSIGYTSDEFWQVASEYKIRAIIGIDAHNTASIDSAKEYCEVREKLSALGITVIEELDLSL